MKNDTKSRAARVGIRGVAAMVAAVIIGMAPVRVAAQGRPITIQVLPVVTMPLAESAEVFTLGAGSALSGEYRMAAGALAPLAGARLEYAYAPFKAADSLSIISAEVLGGTGVSLAPRLDLRASATLGYFYGVINSDGTGGANPSLSAGLDLSFIAAPALDLSLGAAYRNYIGLYHGVSLSLGASVFLSGKEARTARLESAAPKGGEYLAGARPDKPGKGLDLERVTLNEVFPVFRSYYDDKPVGSVVIANKESRPIDGVKLSFYVKQYMDAPKACPAPASILPGEIITVDLTSLFTDAILDVTEATKASAEILLEYQLDGETYRAVRNETVRVLDRNAMRWDDDRRAAAFVTAKDPRVLAFAKHVAGIARDSGPRAVDSSLLVGMAVFKALDLYGVSYVVDPKTPFIEFSRGGGSVDYLQFPRQTLEYRAGDCDDLSILYAALLESVGVETAFVTVPGHIYVAFGIDAPPADLARSFSSPSDFIIRGGRTWLPVEVTERKQGFLAAWQQGAKQWREAEARNEAGFIPVHEAWLEYEPVGLPGAGPELSMPSADAIAAAFLRESSRFIDREIYPLIQKLEAEIKAGGSGPAARNKLGILYARYDRFEQAETEFRAALSKGDYAPALINLGNLQMLRAEHAKALGSFERAAKLDAKNAQAQLGIAMAQRELGDHERSKASYDRAAAINPGLAARYAYLGEAAVAGSRAESIRDRMEAVPWSE